MMASARPCRDVIWVYLSSVSSELRRQVVGLPGGVVENCIAHPINSVLEWLAVVVNVCSRSKTLRTVCTWADVKHPDAVFNAISLVALPEDVFMDNGPVSRTKPCSRCAGSGNRY
ncbi:hypothetical protein KC351_g94 [Hortaea werneckii]|nr:hypothetical protein KC351_g94 [Hortaea werneckii]